MMQDRHHSRRAFILSGATGVGLSFLAMAGCSGEKNMETVVPDVPPEQAAQDSMEWYKKNVAGKKKSVR